MKELFIGLIGLLGGGALMLLYSFLNRKAKPDKITETYNKAKADAEAKIEEVKNETKKMSSGELIDDVNDLLNKRRGKRSKG